jgi:hypothetical protein
MRQPDPPVSYLVGTPKRRLSRLERELLTTPWQEARPANDLALGDQDTERPQQRDQSRHRDLSLMVASRNRRSSGPK